MVASGALSLDDAYKAVDLDTVTLLLGMMIVVASLRLSGFFWEHRWAKALLLLAPPLVAFALVYLAALVALFVSSFWSVNPWWTPDFKELPQHDITRGVKPFSINDEWYYHMRFVDGMKGVTPILSAVPPLNTSGTGCLSLGRCAASENASRMAFTSDWITSS